jgi:hypothetical protein
MAQLSSTTNARATPSFKVMLRVAAPRLCGQVSTCAYKYIGLRQIPLKHILGAFAEYSESFSRRQPNRARGLYSAPARFECLMPTG